MSPIANEYMAAARERLQDAVQAFEADRYGNCLYLSGVAVECVLRAYCTRRDPQFDERHDLRALFMRSRMWDSLKDDSTLRLRAAMDRISLLWHNGHRYRSHAALIRFLKKGRHDRGLKGDILKALARHASTDATLVVQLGVQSWNTNL